LQKKADTNKLLANFHYLPHTNKKFFNQIRRASENFKNRASLSKASLNFGHMFRNLSRDPAPLTDPDPNKSIKDS
jgi:hypothetical protein